MSKAPQMLKQDDAEVVGAEAAGEAADEIPGVNRTVAPESPHPSAKSMENARTQPMSAVLSQQESPHPSANSMENARIQPMSAVLSQLCKTTCTAVSSH